jgi:hypothetical protein
MAIQPIALGVEQPQINGVAAFQAGEANALNAKSERMKQEAAGLQQLAEVGYGVLDHNLDGPINQERLGQVLDLLGENPLAARIKANPELIRTITKGSLEVLSNSQDVAKFEESKRQFEANLNNDTRRLDLTERGLNMDAAKPLTISPGTVLLDPNTKEPIYSNPGKTDTSPTLVSIYDANGREQKGYMGQPDEQHPDGFYPVGAPKADTPRPEFNVSQATAAGYADRMTQSDAILSDPKLTKVMTDLGEVAKGRTPFVGNMLATPEYQQAEQAQRDFINATLRRESGAVISADEFENARKQYFPEVGDSQAKLDQKAANRRNTIHAVARSAGPAYVAPDTTNYLTDGQGGNAPAGTVPVDTNMPGNPKTQIIDGVTYTQDANGDWYAE